MLKDVNKKSREYKSKTSGKRNKGHRSQEDVLWSLAALKTKQVFLNYLLSTINNYLEFYKSDEKLAKLSCTKFSSEDVFDFESYLETFPVKDRDFMKALTETQGFHVFIEKGWKLMGSKFMKESVPTDED